jgi:hypothetical protein
VTVKLLIDECLHTSLVELAHAAGYVADHVNYLGLGGLLPEHDCGGARILP